MNAFTIDGLVVPVMQGQGAEQIERGGGDDVRAATGNLLTSTLWETSSFPLTTGLLTNAEAAEIKRRCAYGREVTCAGSMIDYAGGTVRCVVRVLDGPFITLATDDGSGVMRQLNLLVRAVNEPLEVAWAPGVSLSDATFGRTSTASHETALGTIASVAVGLARDRHYAFRNGSLLRERTLLLEGSRTNVVLHSRDLANAAWIKTNCTAAKDVTGADGLVSSASRLTATGASATCLQAVTLSSSARLQSAYVQRIAGGGTVEMTTDNGATWTAVPLTAGWTRVEIPTQTLANPVVGFRIVTSGDVIAVDYVQNEDSTFRSSVIPTTTVAVTRATDTLSFPFTLPPQELTLYAKFIERGTIDQPSGSKVVLMIGTGGTAPRLLLYQTAGRYTAFHSNGVAVSASAAAAPVIGDLVELRMVLSANGAVQLGQSINGAAETVTAVSAANALASAWFAPTLWLNSTGSGNHGFAAFHAVKVARGLKSLTQMRALAPVT